MNAILICAVVIAAICILGGGSMADDCDESGWDVGEGD